MIEIFGLFSTLWRSPYTFPAMLNFRFPLYCRVCGLFEREHWAFLFRFWADLILNSIFTSIPLRKQLNIRITSMKTTDNPAFACRPFRLLRTCVSSSCPFVVNTLAHSSCQEIPLEMSYYLDFNPYMHTYAKVIQLTNKKLLTYRQRHKFWNINVSQVQRRWPRASWK